MQQYLHDSFAPSWSWISDEDLLRYRSKISRDTPNLPAAAGRAAAKLQKKIAALPPRPHADKTPGKRRVAVGAVIRPKIDEDAMTRALRAVMRDLAKTQDSDQPAA